MNKAKAVALICLGVAIVYLLLLIFMPVMSNIVSDVSANITAGHDTSQYVGVTEGLDIMPWALYLLPAGIGGVAIVVVLKRP